MIGIPTGSGLGFSSLKDSRARPTVVNLVGLSYLQIPHLQTPGGRMITNILGYSRSKPPRG